MKIRKDVVEKALVQSSLDAEDVMDILRVLYPEVKHKLNVRTVYISYNVDGGIYSYYLRTGESGYSDQTFGIEGVPENISALIVLNTLIERFNKELIEGIHWRFLGV